MLFLLLFQTQPLLDLMQPRTMGVVYQECIGEESGYKPESGAQKAQLSMLMELHCPFFRGEAD